MITSFPSHIHPIISNIVAIIQIFGTVQIGKYILTRYWQRSEWVLSLAIGMIIISQTAYLFTFNSITFWFLYLLSFLLLGLGIFNISHDVGGVSGMIKNNINHFNSLFFYIWNWSEQLWCRN